MRLQDDLAAGLVPFSFFCLRAQTILVGPMANVVGRIVITDILVRVKCI